ncbi:MAG: SGNH/GDSL hydrolase family protein [Planctomycetaceae bacterium]|nr:SGNH/GDSL hydrolase family protein [Planctomycetaceae bacterium]
MFSRRSTGLSAATRRVFFTAIIASLSLTVASIVVSADEPAFPLRAQRILFLGDSITHAGGYVNLIEAELRLRHRAGDTSIPQVPEIVNIGLSSETCSGLSEPDHPFPRPDVHERLDRALDQVKPDLVVACYGMNDGIYYPFSEERFAAYRRGIDLLIQKVHAIDAILILITPPPFDPVPLKDSGKLLPAGQEKYAYFAMFEDYDNVLKKYGEWIMEQRDRVEMVINIHQPVTAALAAARKNDPAFTMAPDGIHPNSAGHRVIAQTILKAWGLQLREEFPAGFMELMNQRGTVLHDAWLSHVGHQRPGVKAGLPLQEATTKADELLDQAMNLVP